MIKHGAGDVFDGAPWSMPDGCWISPCGEWQSVVMREHGVHQIGRNHCSCAFCQDLRARWPFEDFMRGRAEVVPTPHPGDAIDTAVKRGWDAYKAGKGRKQVPPEYWRNRECVEEIAAWQRGWDRSAEHDRGA
jgi:hypothetical protein